MLKDENIILTDEEDHIFIKAEKEGVTIEKTIEKNTMNVGSIVRKIEYFCEYDLDRKDLRQKVESRAKARSLCDIEISANLEVLEKKIKRLETELIEKSRRL